MRKVFCIIVLLCLFSRSLALAGDDPLEIISRVHDRYEEIKDAVLSFQQNVVFGMTKNEQTFTGILKMKKSDKYRIELEDQTIVTDGKSVWSYSKSNNQVLVDKYRENPKSLSPDKLLMNVPDEYSTTMLGKEKVGKREWLILKMVPNEKNANLKWMKVWVDDDEYLMHKVQILDVSDNLTTYTIDDLKINTGLSDELFQYKAPPDAEVVDLR
jgi:chaperone LolA